MIVPSVDSGTKIEGIIAWPEGDDEGRVSGFGEERTVICIMPESNAMTVMTQGFLFIVLRPE